jgi:hypothetical protein
MKRCNSKDGVHDWVQVLTKNRHKDLNKLASEFGLEATWCDHRAGYFIFTGTEDVQVQPVHKMRVCIRCEEIDDAYDLYAKELRATLTGLMEEQRIRRERYAKAKKILEAANV